MPRITMALRVPPPAAPFLDPDPFAALVSPVPAVHRRRRHQECVFLSIVRRAFPDDVARIADRFRRAQDLEIARGQIAERVEIVHLAVDVKERVLGPVTRRRSADDHARGIPSLAVDAVRDAGSSPEGAEIAERITQLRFRAIEPEQENERRETEDVFCFHGGSAEPLLRPV